MEDNIILHELFLLYRACSNEFTKSVKASAIGFGAEVDFDDDWYDPAPPEAPKTIQQSDIKFLPIGLGYEAG